MKWPGSNWWKFDFHSHTPASSDYNASERASLSPREWLLKYMQSEIDCVAVTDHNEGGWLNSLQNELREMEGSEPSIEGYRELTLFPGIEITSSDGIHILGIFDPSCDASKISRISALVELPDTGPNAERISTKSAEDICKKIHQETGLVVMAHAENAKGLLEPDSGATSAYSPKREIRQIEKLIPLADAIETHDTSSAAITHFEEKLRSKALVDGSDAHSSNHIGGTFTWVKMSAPNIEGLKLALLDPDSSVLRTKKPQQDPNSPPSLRITGIEIDQLYLRRQSVLCLNLSPWLTSVIGGRGSGKSTIVESIRLGLAREGELELLGDERTSDVTRSFKRFNKIRATRNGSGMLTDSTSITIFCEKDDIGITERYKYLWSTSVNNESSLEVHKLNDAQKWENASLSKEQAGELFPVKIFSQKQIFEFADRPKAILDYIDDSLDLDFKRWEEERQSYCKDIADLRYRERELLSKIANKAPLDLENQEVNRKVRVFQQSNFAEEVKKFQAHREAKKSINEFTGRVKDEINVFSDLVKTESTFTAIELSAIDESINAQQLNAKAAALCTALDSEYGQIINAISRMQSLLSSFESSQEATDFRSLIDTEIANYRQKIEELKQQGIDSAQEAENLIQRQSEIKDSLAEIQEAENELNEVRTKITKAYVRLVRHRKKLTKQRIKFVQDVLSSVPDLKINIQPFEDLGGSLAGFRNALRLQDGTFEDEILGDRDDTGDHGGLLGKVTARNVQTTVHNRLHHLKLGILNKDGEILGHSLNGHLVNKVSSLDEDDHQNLIEWFPEDLVKVEFRRDSASSFQPLENASAGQKTSAILSFILHHGSEPLILDQPEDDLDSGLISSLLVTQLRKSKLKRQVIAVTHNPNIVVNGDAELVIPMEFSSGQIRTDNPGGLQEEGVRKKICAVMEGGEIAFRQRYKRILKDLNT